MARRMGMSLCWWPHSLPHSRARLLGHIYERIDLNDAQSLIEGAIVPADAVVRLIQKIFGKIDNGESSCVLPEAIQNPYFITD